MIRVFAEHTRRRVESLDGTWEFSWLGEADAAGIDLERLTFAHRMPVPGCFDAAPVFRARQGLTAYRRRFTVHKTGPHELRFGRVNHRARVYVDARLVVDHIGGFVPFSAPLPDATEGSHTLIVIVDNRPRFDVSPINLDYYDWYHYGGIAGSVELHALPNHHIRNVRYRTLDAEARRISVAVELTALSDGDVPVSVTLADRALWEGTVSFSEGRGAVTITPTVPGLDLWSPESPALHPLRVDCGEDDIWERVGIRTFAVEGARFVLNGRPVQLQGYNRHHMHPDFGFALPDQIMVGDLMRLKDLGCNFIRGSHYPQDPRFLDLCDELGFLVWEESTGWQNTAEHLSNDRFLRVLHDQTAAMVHASYNHPSVVIRGFLNESDCDTPEGRSAYGALAQALRKADPGRPVTYASHKPNTDLCGEFADILSVNVYPGWYDGEIEEIPDRLDATIETIRRRNKGVKPILLSEIGAGALYGYRDDDGGRWTEQYQTRLLSAVLDYALDPAKGVAGLALWQYCDVRTARNAEKASVRPRGFNNKGVVNEYRLKKEAYRCVKRAFRTGNGPREV